MHNINVKKQKSSSTLEQLYLLTRENAKTKQTRSSSVVNLSLANKIIYVVLYLECYMKWRAYANTHSPSCRLRLETVRVNTTVWVSGQYILQQHQLVLENHSLWLKKDRMNKNDGKLAVRLRFFPEFLILGALLFIFIRTITPRNTLRFSPN